MAAISAAMVKELRLKTDAPMMECKKALTEADGDMAKAEEILRVKLGNKATKAASRITAEGVVAVVSAGTADGFVTHEVARTLTYLGWTVRLFEDCGVAGLWRIQKALPDINRCDVVVAVAGLDAALPTVLGGLTMKPLFAVPTSVGYGIADGGKTALRSMLASCSPGVAVFNIDNGYGAACAAARTLRAIFYR